MGKNTPIRRMARVTVEFEVKGTDLSSIEHAARTYAHNRIEGDSANDGMEVTGVDIKVE